MASKKVGVAVRRGGGRASVIGGGVAIKPQIENKTPSWGQSASQKIIQKRVALNKTIINTTKQTKKTITAKVTITTQLLDTLLTTIKI